tara:strand:- start:3204 stop:3395 length:192 start_codon:yes stop_codon:yes gene_type:complete
LDAGATLHGNTRCLGQLYQRPQTWARRIVYVDRSGSARTQGLNYRIYAVNNHLNSSNDGVRFS